MGKSAYRYLKKLLELSNYHEKQVELIAVDSAGHYYTEHGRMGMLRGMKYLESAPERVSYVSNSLTVDDSRMVFLKQLSTPSHCKAEKKDHPVLLWHLPEHDPAERLFPL